MCYENPLYSVFFPQPLHLTLVRGAMTTLNELPGTSKSSSIFRCCLFSFSLPLLYFPRKNITGILLFFHFYYTKYGVPWWRWRERMIFCSNWQGKNVIKIFKYEVYTTLESFNPVSLKLNRYDSERSMIQSISNSTFVVEVGPEPIPWSSLRSLKIS